MYEYLDKLNAEQHDAATTVKGNVLIIAGAGTGKTSTLIARTSYMLDEGINPENILLLTFTNKSAKDMQYKIAENIGGEAAEKITATTFHSFCANFLRKYSDLIGIDNSFTILDSPDCVDVMDIILDEVGITPDDKFPSKKAILNMHSVAINSCIPFMDVVLNSGYASYLAQLTLVANKYAAYKTNHNMMDYDDLLFYTHKILSTHDDIRKLMDEKYKYISCDEYQDTNCLQDKILFLMSQDYPNLAVVGDDNQSIYAFRCAEIENILSFEKRRSGCYQVVLKENYRSSREILDFCNRLMSHTTEGIEKYLKGQFNGEKPTLYIAQDEEDETNHILQQIEDYHNTLDIGYRDMAVIIRNGYQSFRLEAKLNAKGIPYKKFGGIKFLEKEVIKDLLAFLKVNVNPHDQLAFFRTLNKVPKVGSVTAKKIFDQVETLGLTCLNTLYPTKSFNPYLCNLRDLFESIETMELEEKLKAIIGYYTALIDDYVKNSKSKDKADMKDKYTEQLKEAEVLVSMAHGYRSTKKFLEDLILEAAVPDADGDYLNITTIHSAKGLEYDVAFVMDCVDGIFPKCPPFTPGDSEELRCMYVACTRAKYFLHLSAPQRSYVKGAFNAVPLSHFLNYDDVLDSLDIVGDAWAINRMRNTRIY